MTNVYRVSDMLEVFSEPPGIRLIFGIFCLLGGLLFFPFFGKLATDLLQWVLPSFLTDLDWVAKFFIFFRWFSSGFGALFALYGTALLVSWSFDKVGMVNSLGN